MQTYYITFSSGTQAQKGENLLKKRGYSSTVVRTPGWMEERGCGYALKITCGNILPVLEGLRRNRLTVRRVYLHDPEGTMKEVVL